jgi:hypothetical protein
MNNTNIAIKEIENLIVANYERMVAFEHSAFNATSSNLKEYFEEKAAESEMNIAELTAVISEISGYQYDLGRADQINMLGASHLFIGKKNIHTLLKNIQYLEKAVINWYKTGMKNLKGLSQHITLTLSKHYTGLHASHVYVQSC